MCQYVEVQCLCLCARKYCRDNKPGTIVDDVKFHFIGEPKIELYDCCRPSMLRPGQKANETCSKPLRHPKNRKFRMAVCADCIENCKLSDWTNNESNKGGERTG